jgi:glycosyltransferase involved in cell wall biosynthesis
MPLVSEIIPTLNRAQFISSAIDSVWAQTFHDFELIVMDDGSTEGTEAILARSYPNIRVFSQTNRGVASARNLGIRNPSGEFIAFLDSDDAWLPRKLEK